jgi:tRNA(Leu) C34 or U34 (ribose-2'-O)-methylase TrmL
MKKSRGYFGIVFYEPKFDENIGTAVRSAHCFGADFIGVIGKRYKKQPSDTMATERHIPIYEWADTEDFLRHIPVGCDVVGVEMDGEDITQFHHPDRAIYVLGGEDRNAPAEIKKRLKISTSHCLNMAVAASVVMFHRTIQ